MRALGARLPDPRFLVAGAMLVGAGVLLARLGYGAQLSRPLALVLFAAALAYLIWHASPTWTLTAGFLLSPIAGYWQQFGIPGALSPNRLLLVGGVVAVVFRNPADRSRPPLPGRPVHLAMAAAALWVIASAAIGGTLLDKTDFVRMFEAFGLLLFAVYYVAPAAFRSRERRKILLVAMVALGAYLGLTSLFETVHLDALVFPRYINNPAVGIHANQARGPFVEAVTNGTALFLCGTAAVAGFFVFRGRWARTACLVTVALCGVGVVFCLERSVWLASIVAAIIGIVGTRLRRWLVPLFLGAAVLVGVAYLVTGSSVVKERVNAKQSVWDRDNLNTAAVRMIEARPLQGFGWGRFVQDSVDRDFFRQSPGYPLTTTAPGLEVHNEFLSHGAELGLIGLTLWCLPLVMALWIGLTAPASTREERVWRSLLLSYAAFYIVVSNFVPPQLFPNLMLWLLAGVAGGRRLLGEGTWRATHASSRPLH